MGRSAVYSAIPAPPAGAFSIRYCSVNVLGPSAWAALMQNDTRTVQVVFVAPSDSDAKAVIAVLQALPGLASLSVNDAPGAVSGQKIIAAVITFSLNVGAGVVGNAIYGALHNSPAVQCVVGETALSKEEASNAAKLGARIQTEAKETAPRADAH